MHSKRCNIIHNTEEIHPKRQRFLSEQICDDNEAIKPLNQSPTTAINKKSFSSSGTLESVILKNFMCHKFLKVHFEPRINFIIGHNGSGKSAILTAITICLGGRASTTNRGTSLKSLIREGQQVAEIQLKIRNSGFDGFEQDRYGKLITVIRRLSSDGSSSYKIKSEDGRIASTRRDDLNDILDHYGIQPDNPLLILNQDAAKQFLQSSTSEKRYELFMRGTRLLQLRQSYDKVAELIDGLGATLEGKKERISQMKQDVRRSNKKLEQMRAHSNAELKINELKKKIAWSQVYDEEHDLLAEKDDKLQKEDIVQQVETRISNTEQQLREVRNRMAEVDRTLDEIENHPKEPRAQEISSFLEQYQIEVRQITKMEGKINDEIKLVKQDLKDLDSRRNAEMLKQGDKSSLDDRNTKVKQMEQLDDELNEIGIEIDRLKGESGAADRKLIDDYKEDADNLKRRLNQLDQDVRQYQDQLEDLKSSDSSNNRLIKFGRQLPKMHDFIDHLYDQGKFYGQKPLGPLGMFIRLKDDVWSTSIDAHLGPNTPYAFIVTDSRDVKSLQRVFEKFSYGNYDRQRQAVRYYYDIFTARLDPNFDYSQGVPARNERYKTMLDVFNIKNELVKQVLINSYSIESVILVKSRMLGNEIMRRSPDNVFACFDVDANKIGHRGGGNVNLNMARRNFGHGGFKALCCDDSKDHIRKLEGHILKCEEEKKRISSSLEDLNSLIGESEDRFEALNSKISELEDKQNESFRKRNEIYEYIEEMDISNSNQALETIESQIKQKETHLGSLREQFADSLENRQRIKKEHDSLLEELESINKEIFDHRAHFDEQKAKQAEIINLLDKHQQNLEHYQSRHIKYSEQVEKAIMQIAKHEEEIELAKRQANEYCDNQPIDMSDWHENMTASLGRELEETTLALQERQSLTGTMEDAVTEAENRRKLYSDAKKELKSISAMKDLLMESLKDRRKSWRRFRNQMSLSATLCFQFLLSSRNYTGDLKFNHQSEKLEIHVETKDISNQLTGPRSSRSSKRDPRGLSGGEKSFSTICLLLSLWEAMGCNIRGLDEFDVFMDSVNRRISMSMMIDSARKYPKTQYILITPQAMDNIKSGDEIHIFRLKDPERQWGGGQRTIDEMVTGAD